MQRLSIVPCSKRKQDHAPDREVLMASHLTPAFVAAAGSILFKASAADRRILPGRSNALRSAGTIASACFENLPKAHSAVLAISVLVLSAAAIRAGTANGGSFRIHPN